MIHCAVESCAWCFSGGASGKVVLAERQVRLQSLLWAGHADYESQATSVRTLNAGECQDAWFRRYCTAQTPVQDTCHWLLTIVALGWQVVVFQRHAVRCSTGLSSLWMTRARGKRITHFVPASHLAAAQSGQHQGKEAKRTFRGRSPSTSTLPATVVF